MTLQAHVRAGQRKLGLAVMVELPERPAVGIVAVVACWPELTLVMRILVAFMA